VIFFKSVNISIVTGKKADCIVHLSLITALVCDSRSFSDISVSQGSVATHVRCGGLFNKQFAANLLENQTVKNFHCLIGRHQTYGGNRVTAISLVSPTFGTRCSCSVVLGSFVIRLGPELLIRRTRTTLPPPGADTLIKAPMSSFTAAWTTCNGSCQTLPCLLSSLRNRPIQRLRQSSNRLNWVCTIWAALRFACKTVLEMSPAKICINVNLKEIVLNSQTVEFARWYTPIWHISLGPRQSVPKRHLDHSTRVQGSLPWPSHRLTLFTDHATPVSTRSGQVLEFNVA